MPELPEVHTITADLNSSISGFDIQSVEISKGYSAHPSNIIFKKAVVGQKILGTSRVAKNILIELSSGNTILIHLAMTGRVLLRDRGYKEDSWTKVRFGLTRNAEEKELRFTDTRMFGKVMILNDKAIEKLKSKYGPEPLNSTLSDEEFLKILKSKRTNIKNALLDQSLVSGLGNIYATEALFIAGINPNTQTTKITIENANGLLKASREVLEEGISNRGSTLPDKSYVDIFGKEGKQQNYFKVYMREVCPKCNRKIIFVKLNGRGTYYCENCQPSEGQSSLFI